MRLAPIGKLILYACLMVASPAQADTIKGRLAKMPPPQFTSVRSMGALEWCIGVGFGDWFMPMTLHGDAQSFVYMGMDTEFNMGIVSAALIRDEGERRTISWQSPKAWAERTEKIVRECL